MKEKTMKIQGYTCSQRSIFLFVLCSFCFATPVKGYSLRNCRISHLTHVICAKSKLTAVPHDIPSTVIKLDMSKNQVSKIGVSDLKDLKNLKCVDLRSNIISEIDVGAFADLNSLEVLNLNQNRLNQLRDHQFQGLSNLTELRLRNNHIKTVASSSFQSLTNLKTLDLDGNNLQCLANVHTILQHLPHLKDLSVQWNSLSTFQSWELSNNSMELTALDLSQNPIEVFRITADVFPNLTRLNLGHCGIKKDKWIWDVHNNPFLNRVSNLDISGLHMSFSGMKTLLEGLNSSLTELRINDIQYRRKFEALVNTSCKIPSLTTLKLQKNHLKFVTSNLLVLCINVTELDLTGNRLQNLAEDAFKSLQRLRILNLSNNTLSTVPAATRNLQALKELDLSHNNISTLRCQDFANLTGLIVLYLHENVISTLKDCVFKDLRELQLLKIQSNHISNLAGAFKIYLLNLRSLDLSGNIVNAIRQGEFKSLHSLHNLSLHDNKIIILENGAFAGLTNLKKLQLASNLLDGHQLRTGVFSDISNLISLNLMDNHITYEKYGEMFDPPFSNLSRLKTLIMNGQHHRLKSNLPSNFLKGLTNLTLFNARNIQLTSLYPHMFEYTPRLETLDLSSNDFTDISSDVFSPVSKLSNLYLSRTNLRSLDFLSQANLTRLVFLQLRKNAFSVISKEIVLQSLPSLAYLDLQGNSFTCDCDNAWFLQWVKDNKQTQVYDAYNFECNYPSDLKGKKLLDLDVHSCSADISFYYFISTTCTTIFFLLGSLTYHLLRWQVVYAYYLLLAFLYNNKLTNRRAPHQYDAFVSYNIHDEPWVLRELLPKLEGEQGWRLCLHHRDFQPGKPIIDNITDAIYGSRKTICVISHHYLESEWCSREIQVASFRLFDEQKDVLILVFLEEIPAQQLSPYHRMRRLLKRRTYLSWPRAGQHTELFWEKLRLALRTKEGPAEDSPLLTGMERP